MNIDVDMGECPEQSCTPFVSSGPAPDMPGTRQRIRMLPTAFPNGETVTRRDIYE